MIQVGVTTSTVLGTVVGTKTLDGQWAGKSKMDDAPAVVTKPLSEKDAPIKVVAEPQEPASPPEKVAAEPKAPPEPAVGETPEPKAKPPAGADPEKKAHSLLSLANNYLASGNKELAFKKYSEVMDKYPDTEAAKEAKEKLANWK